jgi:Fe-S cluster assembly iron-binding protein IscA
MSDRNQLEGGRLMLALTDTAVEVVKEIVASDGPAEDAGLRMVAVQEGSHARFQLTVAAVPGEDDEVVETHGARVFLEPNAASLLGDKLLDAFVAENEVSFTIVDQPAP